MTSTSGIKCLLLLAMGSAVTVVVACAHFPHGAELSADANTVAARECPGPYMAIVDTTPKGNSTPTVTTYREVKLARSKSQVAEFHDCQGFIVDGSYKALYAVFASYALDSIDEVLDSTRADPNTIVAGVEIYTRTGKYDPLHISPGFNCIYFRGDTKFTIAYVTNSPHDEKKCELTSAADLVGAPTVPVRRLPIGSLADTDYPAVARWQRRANGQYFIGMKCGAAWCEVGVPDGPVALAVPTSAPALAPGDPRRVAMVPGWNDQQTLAVPAGAGVKPSTLLGTVIPSSTLNDQNEPGSFADWVNAGTIALAGDVGLPQYHTKLGVRQGSNDLQLRFYVRIAGLYPGIETLPPTIAHAINASGKDTVWIARVISSQHETTYLKVIRTGHEHEDFKIPGTMRWRWQSLDETIWVRCLEGCCQVQQTD